MLAEFFPQFSMLVFLSVRKKRSQKKKKKKPGRKEKQVCSKQAGTLGYLPSWSPTFIYFKVDR
jgi:hypothetical protein